MNKSRGFTLIELMAVLVLLVSVLLLSLPVISKTLSKSKENAFKDYNTTICSAALTYFEIENKRLTDNIYRLSVGDLIELNYVSSDIENPLTNEIEYNSNIYIYLTEDNEKKCYFKDVGDYSDSTAPVINSISVTPATNSIVITVDVSEEFPELIKEYYFSIDGENYISSDTPTATISNLTSNTNYTVYVRVLNISNLEATRETTTTTL